MTSRDDPTGVQAEYEPGSRGRVLRNLLGIKRLGDIQLAESQALRLAQADAIERFSADHCFSAADIRLLHRIWLGPIYAWAGETRSINIGKGGFQFATATLIPGLMAGAERTALAHHTPCAPASDESVALALAAVHAELVLIHPFRDGNGRLMRLVSLLMGLQAGLPPLDFSPLDGRGKNRYIAGIHAAMGRDYVLLTEMFRKVIDRTRTSASSSSR